MCLTDFFFHNNDNKKRWGESAGAMSISLHMIAAAPHSQHEPSTTTTTTTTTNLYRAAFMQSGSPLSLGDLTNGQHAYDDIVIETGCSGEGVDDTLACLRRVPYERIKAVIDRSPGFLDYGVSFLSFLSFVLIFFSLSPTLWEG